MKNLVKEWIEKWRSTPHKEESQLRKQEWRMAAKTPSFGMFELLDKKVEEDPIVKEAREALERLSSTPPRRVSQPDYATIDRVGALARQFVAQGLTLNPIEETERFRQEMLGEFPAPVETPEPPEVREIEEEEHEIVARTTTSTTRRRKTKTTPGRSSVGGPATKNDPIFTWDMQSSKPRNGGHIITYEVRLNEDGTVSCNCPGWIFKKKTNDRGCKHTRHETIVREAPDFFQRHQRGEQLPIYESAGTSTAPSAPRGPDASKDQMKGFGRVVILDD